MKQQKEHQDNFLRLREIDRQIERERERERETEVRL